MECVFFCCNLLLFVKNVSECYQTVTIGNSCKKYQFIIFCSLSFALKRIHNNGDIIQQYVRFTKVYNEQVGLYGRNAKAVAETLKICENEDVLADYLKSREKEVSGIMLAFSDIDKQFDMYVNGEKKIAKEEGWIEGKAEGKAEGIFSTLVALVKDKILTLSQAAQRANMTIEEFEEKSGLKAE